MIISKFHQKFFEYTNSRKYKATINLVENALSEGLPADQLITKGIAENLKKFQTYFDEGYENISAFQLLAIGKIAEDSIEKIKPFLLRRGREEKKRKVIIGTIKDDFHGLGKKILKLFLEMENFEVIDLGLNVSPDVFIKTIEENENIEFLFISTMMIHNIIGIKRVGDLLAQYDLRDKIKFYVGGAPFNYNYGLVEKVGADGTAEDVYELMDKILGRTSRRKKKSKRIFRFFRREK